MASKKKSPKMGCGKVPGTSHKMPGYLGNNEGRARPEWFRGQQVGMTPQKAMGHSDHQMNPGSGKFVFDRKR